MSWQQILVATDFSEHAAAALDLALDLAESLGASVTILHSYHAVIPQSVPPTGGGFRISGSVARELRARSQEAVAELVRQHARAGVPMRGEVVEAPPAFAITSEAERLPADLIVMGARGQSGLRRVLLGSVAAKVLRTAPCPVLTVHADEARCLDS